jgi:hypothetical protein
VVEKDLDDQSAEGVAHDDRGLVELADDTFVALDDSGDRQRLDRAGIGVECLDLDLEARIRGSDDGVPLLGVALDPVLPAAGRDP